LSVRFTGYSRQGFTEFSSRENGIARQLPHACPQAGPERNVREKFERVKAAIIAYELRDRRKTGIVHIGDYLAR